MQNGNGLTEAQRLKQSEEALARRVMEEIEMLKCKSGYTRDDEFAHALGISYGRYRNIRRDPLSLHMRELHALNWMSEQAGMGTILLLLK